MNWPSFFLGVFYACWITGTIIIVLACAVADDDAATRKRP